VIRRSPKKRLINQTLLIPRLRLQATISYGLGITLTVCPPFRRIVRNYGPKQFTEKFIPHLIFRALQGEKLPVYGKGENIRDWIHVRDHCRGVLLALEKGWVGESYCFGGNSEVKNIDLALMLCKILDKKRPRARGKYADLIEFVSDRPGHDLRYAIDDSKAKKDLGYERSVSDFETGLEETVEWYLKNTNWAKRVTEKSGAQIKYDWSKIS
jgi:dTDP-glucose 4,6-dehydratase